MQYPESKWIDYICAQYEGDGRPMYEAHEADRYIQQQAAIIARRTKTINALRKQIRDLQGQKYRDANAREEEWLGVNLQK